MTKQRLVTINEAAEMTGTCRRTIYNWLAAGKVKSVRIASGLTRIYADSLFLDGTTKSGEPVSSAE